jgi:uncharacterized protein YcaQ
LPPITLTRAQARRFLLAYQALWPPRSLSGKEGILDYIRRVGCIQFDPLDMAGQNAELVLQSRVSDFQSGMLRELLYQDRQLLDGYDKNMAIYPIEDWPYFSRRRLAAQSELRSSDEVQAITPKIIAEIEARGPLSSLDLDFDQTVHWYWAPTRLARAALESMYFAGKLVIHRKIHTRKVYDLAQRHIPESILQSPDPNPSISEYQDWYVLRRIGSMGLLWNRGSECWLGVPANSTQRSASLKRLIEYGKVLEVNVEGIDPPLYMRIQDLKILDEILNSHDAIPRIAFIAPLDNLMWDRRLLEALFGFYYRWEVYTPQARREYGYYVIPVLYGDRFVARFEPVRNKKNGMLTIKNWWWEPGVNPSDEIIAAMRECLEYFFTFLNITQINFNGRTVNLAETGMLATQLAAMQPRSEQ